MPHNISLITTIVAGLGLALIFGFIASRLRMPPLVGYLLAGVLIGPATPGFVADVDLAGQLAEIGVMLLMFGVGLHFSTDDLLSVRKLAVPGAIVQIAVATALGAATALYWGWSIGTAVVFGLALSVASTVVLLRSLEDRGLLSSLDGRIAVGWLVVEDLVMVLVLVLLPALAGLLGGHGATSGQGSLLMAVAITLAKVVAFVALMLLVGRKLFPGLLRLVANTGSRELFTLSVLATALVVAFLSARFFDVSFALGAFFAGMMMRESEFSHRAADESLPLRDAFSVLFFVSVGMLFDPAIVLNEPLKLAGVVAIVMFGKALAAVSLVLGLHYPLHTALVVGAGLAQVGEFSFILAGLGMHLGLLNASAQNLILGAALLSIGLNAALFNAVEPVHAWILRHSPRARRLAQRQDDLAALPGHTDSTRLSGHVVLVGYGRVGERIAQRLEASGIPYTVAEQKRQLVERLRSKNIPAVAGDASDPTVLIQAHIARAAMLIIATPEPLHFRKMVGIARQLNPAIEAVLRTHDAEESALLNAEQVGRVFMGENELAHGMANYVLDRFGHAPIPASHLGASAS